MPVEKDDVASKSYNVNVRLAQNTKKEKVLYFCPQLHQIMIDFFSRVSIACTPRYCFANSVRCPSVTMWNCKRRYISSTIFNLLVGASA